MTRQDSVTFRKIDTKTLSTTKTKHTLHFLSCFNADSSARTVIIDANMNYDFSDDIPIFLGKTSGESVCMINYEYYDKQIYQMNVILRLRPLPILFQTLAEEDNDYDAKHSLIIDIFEHRQATFLFEGKTYNISIASGGLEYGRFNKYDLSIRTKGNSTYLNEKAYKGGSTIPVGNAFFSTSVDMKGEKLILKKVEK